MNPHLHSHSKMGVHWILARVTAAGGQEQNLQELSKDLAPQVRGEEGCMRVTVLLQAGTLLLHNMLFLLPIIRQLQLRCICSRHVQCSWPCKQPEDALTSPLQLSWPRAELAPAAGLPACARSRHTGSAGGRRRITMTVSCCLRPSKMYASRVYLSCLQSFTLPERTLARVQTLSTSCNKSSMSCSASERSVQL